MKTIIPKQEGNKYKQTGEQVNKQDPEVCINKQLASPVGYPTCCAHYHVLIKVIRLNALVSIVIN